MGRVFLLFTDIEGSTSLIRAVGPDVWEEVLAEHAAIVGGAITEHQGWVDSTEGDSFFATFRSGPSAAEAAYEALRGLRNQDWPAGVGELRVRMGLHVGQVRRATTGYVGIEVHRAARIAAAANGGQLLVSDACRPAVAGVLDLVDVGLHRLKDFPAPEHHFCAVVEGRGPEDFPPPRTLGLRPTNLPAGIASLVGRDEEVKEVLDALDSARIVTITGPGGVGKSALALRVADQSLDRYPGGVWWVPLANWTDPVGVLGQVAGVVHANPSGRLPVTDALRARLEGLACLVVLDNLEHLIEAAPEVSTLVDLVPNLHLLTTSQVPLRVGTERVFSLEPLEDDAAMTLFDLSAGAVGVALMAPQARNAAREVCRALDGIPLAIELAASRLAVWSPQQLRARLPDLLGLLQQQRRDGLQRHESMSRTLGWTLGLLPPAPRALFRRLGVFALPPTLSDIAVVLSQPEEDLVDDMSALLDLAVTRRTEEGDGYVRFVLPEMLRQVAVTELEADEHADEYRWAHARHVRDVQHPARLLLGCGRDEYDAAARLGLDVERARQWAVQHDLALAQDLAATRGLLLVGLGRVREAQPELDFVLGSRAVDPVVTARAQFAAATSLMFRGDFLGAFQSGEQALPVIAELDPPAHAMYQVMVAGLRGFTGDIEGALRDAELAEEQVRALCVRGDTPEADTLLIGVLMMRAQVTIMAGDLTLSARLVEEVRIHNQSSPAMAGRGLHTQTGDLALAKGRPADAIGHYARSLTAAEQHRDDSQIMFDLVAVVRCLAALGRTSTALKVLGVARAQATQVFGTTLMVDMGVGQDATESLLAEGGTHAHELIVKAAHTPPAERGMLVRQLLAQVGLGKDVPALGHGPR